MATPSKINIKNKKMRGAELEVPDWHKKLVLNRIKTSQKKDFLSWSDVKKQIKQK